MAETKKYTEVATIPLTLERARAEGLAVPETALRRWLHEGKIPAVYVGKKALIYWPSFVSFVQGSSRPGNALESVR